MCPLYDYSCEKCDLDFEVFKNMSEHKPKEPCPQCKNLSAQDLSRCRPMFTGASVKDAYKCPALGQIVKSDSHRKDLARKLGVEEIGNEKPDRLHKHFDDTRAEKMKKSWDEV